MGTLKGFGTGFVTVVALAVALGGGCDGCRRAKLAPRRDGAAVVVITADSLVEPGVAMTEEKEPNDTLAVVQVLALGEGGGTTGVTVAGSLPAKDVDLFRVNVPGTRPDAGPDAGVLAARRLIVDVYPEPGLATRVTVLDEAGGLAASSNAAAGERDGVPNLSVSPGATYFLRLERVVGKVKTPPPDAGGGSGYRVTAKIVAFEGGDEREPNGAAGTATDLGIVRTNPEGAGFHGWFRDEDWYRVSLEGLPSGSVLAAELTGVEGVTASLAVCDAAGNRLATVRGRRNQRVVLEGVAFPPTGDASAAQSARIAYVVVRAELGRNLDRRYVLSVRTGVGRGDNPAADAAQGARD